MRKHCQDTIMEVDEELAKTLVDEGKARINDSSNKKHLF